MTPFPVLKLCGVLCWHGSRHHGTGSSILGILDNLLTCLFCCVCDLFASVCFPRKTLLLAEEVLTKQLSFQDVYVHLVPTFFTESCKWERERPYRPWLNFPANMMWRYSLTICMFCFFPFNFPLGGAGLTVDLTGDTVSGNCFFHNQDLSSNRPPCSTPCVSSTFVRSCHPEHRVWWCFEAHNNTEKCAGCGREEWAVIGGVFEVACAKHIESVLP